MRVSPFRFVGRSLCAVMLFGLCGVLSTPVQAQAQVPDEAALPAGLSLPHAGMVHVVDTTAKGPVLEQLHATEIVSNSHAAGNFLRSQVFVGARGSVEVKGLNADVHLQSTQPSFLVRLSGDDAELMRSRIHLIRLTQTKDRRVVATRSQNIFGGQQKKQYDDVPLKKVGVGDSGWLKVTPETSLAPGEYAIAIMPSDVNLYPDSVYDFNVGFESAKAEK